MAQTRDRGPNRIPPTSATGRIYRDFIRPFIDRFILAEGHVETEEGYRAFFGTNRVAIWFCKARRGFKMPGLMWSNASLPGRFVNGTGQRQVKEGEALVLRFDREKPNVCELEYQEQVFHLREYEYNTIAAYLEREGSEDPERAL